MARYSTETEVFSRAISSLLAFTFCTSVASTEMDMSISPVSRAMVLAPPSGMILKVRLVVFPGPLK